MTVRPMRALAALAVAGTVACTATVPTPSPSEAPTATAFGVASPATTPLGASPTPGSSEGRKPGGSLAEEVTPTTIDTTATGGVLAFASSGSSVYFGAGAPGSEDYAPDLFRYVPGADAPELVWRNPDRERAIGMIAGDLDAVLFVDMDGNGERDWNLWLIPDVEAGDEPILMDRHPGDANVSSLLPSLAVSEGRVAWTAFDRGTNGPVSQLLTAAAPDWSPQLLEERDAATGELWLPSLRSSRLVYCEIEYNADRTNDVRHVYLTDAIAGAPRVQLDDSGLATMPVFAGDGVIWKETDPGFNMFNWGHLVYWNELTQTRRALSSGVQPDVNYPSAGERFVAVHGYDTGVFAVFDADRMQWRVIGRFDGVAGEGVYRAHVAGSLIAWYESGPDVGLDGALRWAYLPGAGADRLEGP